MSDECLTEKVGAGGRTEVLVWKIVVEGDLVGGGGGVKVCDGRVDGVKGDEDDENGDVRDVNEDEGDDLNDDEWVRWGIDVDGGNDWVEMKDAK